jgi:hypothetical protein
MRKVRPFGLWLHKHISKTQGPAQHRARQETSNSHYCGGEARKRCAQEITGASQKRDVHALPYVVCFDLLNSELAQAQADTRTRLAACQAGVVAQPAGEELMMEEDAGRFFQAAEIMMPARLSENNARHLPAGL